jgi:hypothetical protein
MTDEEEGVWQAMLDRVPLDECVAGLRLAKETLSDFPTPANVGEIVRRHAMSVGPNVNGYRQRLAETNAKATEAEAEWARIDGELNELAHSDPEEFARLERLARDVGKDWIPPVDNPRRHGALRAAMHALLTGRALA